MARSATKTAKAKGSVVKPAAAIAARPLANMAACVADANAAIRDRDPGPADPREFRDLTTRLPPAGAKLAPIYQAGMFDPFVATLTGLGEAGFDEERQTIRAPYPPPRIVRERFSSARSAWPADRLVAAEAFAGLRVCCCVESFLRGHKPAL